MSRNIHGGKLIPGVNVDRIDIAAGMVELAECGYTEPRTRMVIEYALQRWARGEEGAADRAAVDPSFYGIDFTSWRRVLAAAMAAASPDDVDLVNHPPHYRTQPGIPFECIEITRNMTFCAGNAVKYLWRTDFKNGRQDIEKAQWYLDDALRHADPIFLRMDLYVEREVERKLDVVAQAQTNPHRQWFFIAIRDRHLEAAIECVRNLLTT